MLAALSAAEPAGAFNWWPFGSKGIDYAIQIDGVDQETRDWFKKLKLDEKTSDKPPRNLEELEQDGATRSARLREALAAKGYYDALVEYHLDKAASPPALLYAVKPESRYRLSGVNVAWEGGEVMPVDPATLDVKEGQYADAEAINTQGAKLDIAVGKDTCLLSLSVTPVLQLSGKGPSASLVYRIKHGPRANFGEAVIRGNKKVHDSAILRSVAWKRGKCFTDADVTKTQSSLIGTQLFSTVKVTPAAEVDGNGEVPVTIEVAERVARTASIGLNYATDQGFGTKFGWQHRNFLGDAEKVDANAVVAEQEQSIAVTARDPGFRRDDQTLVLSSSLKHEDTDAYVSQDFEAGAAVERKISPHLNASLGAGYLLTRSKDVLTGEQNFGLLSLPGFIDYDTRDNAQDARKGVFAHLAVTPYANTFDLSTDFFKALVTGQTYLSSDMKGKPTLAMRGSLGGIGGASSESLPSNLRFYAGGGGSVRGYSYQSLSPRFRGDPVGGGSLIEMTAELRVRFTDTLGGVAFIDGGNAYEASVPDFSNPLYYGAGLGVRYYSPLGPLRLDVGVPLNGTNINGSGVDAKGMQIYVSLGQAF